jgi:CBS domain-containing protein
MQRARPVSANMTAVPHAIEAGATLADAQRRMHELKLTQLPVLDDEGKPRGVLMERDLIIARQLAADLGQVTVGALIPREAFSVLPDESLASVVRSMASRAASCVAVVSGNELRGVFTHYDGLRILAEILEGDARPSAPATELQGSLLDEGYLLERAEESARRLSEDDSADVGELYMAVKELLEAQQALLEADQRELACTQADQLPLHRTHLLQLCSERECHTQALAALLGELEDRSQPLLPVAARVSGAIAELRSHRERERDALRFVS